MHGGGRGSGAPKGEKNGRYKDGARTAEAIELRKKVTDLLRSLAKEVPA